MKIHDTDLRKASLLSDAVDEAIIMYEEGKTEEAMKLLSAMGFRALEVHRILKNPADRRTFIDCALKG